MLRLGPLAKSDNLEVTATEKLAKPDALAPVATEAGSAPVNAREEREFTADDFAQAVWETLPLAVLFKEVNGSLPNHVDIDEKGNPVGPGAAAALNFLSIAEIKLPELLKADRRARENILNKANGRVSADFNSFWSQTLGKSGKLSLKCDLDHYDAGNGEKSGKPPKRSCSAMSRNWRERS